MARSKGSPAPTGGPPQGWYPPEHDLQARGAGQQGQPAYPQQGQPPYQGQPYPPQPSADPFAQAPRGFDPAQAAMHQGQAAARPQWVPAFERYTPPGHPQQAVPGDGYDPYAAQREPMPQDQWRGQEQPRTGPPSGYAPQPAGQGYPAPQPGGYLPEPSFGAAPPAGGSYQPGQQAALSSYSPPQAQGYAPSQNPFAQPQHGHANGYPAQQGFGAPQGHGGPEPHGGNGWPTPEQQNWDLAHYQPGQMPQDPSMGTYPGHELTHDARYAGHGGPSHGHAPSQHWGEPMGGHDPHGGHGVEPHFDPMRGGHHDDFSAQMAAAGDRQDQYGYDEPVEEAEEEEPKRGPRTMVIVAALLGAIVLGGGLAYTYKMFGDGKGGTATPVVRADKSPAKMKPTDPGGKDVANIDKKFLNKLGEEKAGATAASANAEADGGSRKVTTLIVNRDGSLTPQGGGASVAPPAPAAAPPAAPTSGVPGLFVEGLTPAPAAPPPQRPQLRNTTPIDTPPVAAAPAPSPPKVADLPLPKVKAEAPPAPRKKPAVRDDALAPAASSGGSFATTTTATTASAGSSGGNGYVAIVASKKSREEALKTFADLNQKFPDAVSGMTPDVKEVDLGAKGVWYRLVLGPPGSREAAKDVCTKLEASGFKGCWSSAY